MENVGESGENVAAENVENGEKVENVEKVEEQAEAEVVTETQ